MGQFSQKVLALDVPVLIPLDRSITASCSFQNWSATTVHLLCVRVSLGTSAATEQSFVQTFPIPIKLYDTLPLYRQFNEPVCETQVSADNQVLLDVKLPNSAVGPQDQIQLLAKVTANHLYKRAKKLQLKLVTLQLKEIMEGYDGGLPAKREVKLYSETREHDSTLTTEGISNEFTLKLPFENDLLDLYSSFNAQDYSDSQVNFITASFNKNKNFSKLTEGVPLTHVQGFTLLGKLFSLRYELVLKVKISHGKDLDCVIPLIVSPYNRTSSKYLMLWILHECQIARDFFGKAAVLEIASYARAEEMYKETRRHCAPPTLYFNNIADWEQLGYNPELFGKKNPERVLLGFID